MKWNAKDTYVLTRMALVFCAAIFILYPVCTYWLDNYRDEVWHSFVSLGIGLLGGGISLLVGNWAEKHYAKTRQDNP